jgi:hypothetical protein
MISRRAFSAGLLACLGGCATHHESGPSSDLPDIGAGYRPDPKSDEAGLWLKLDKVEQNQRRSPGRIRDKPINDLVQDMVCRLAGAYCPDLRPYVIRVPAFNATCAPNGMISIWSGLLLRCHSESQLAAVLGHEIGHYLKRHSLQRLRNSRELDDFAAFFQFQLQGPAAGLIRGLSQDITQASKSMFSRDHEREADALGLALMADAGYAPAACADIWRHIKAEDAAGGESERFDFFLSTHPATTERIDNLDELARRRPPAARPAPDRLNAALGPLRRSFMADEINQGHFKRTDNLLTRLIGDGIDPGGALFYRGELYRRRNRDGDEAIALGNYHDACETADPPAEAFRGVGTIRWRRGETELAREYFRRYLRVAPNADDGDMIRKYLSGA